ncbi:hypothetical protein H0H92_015159, partial [Tricholoma furcatifolium]
MANTIWTSDKQPNGKVIRAVAALGGVQIQRPTSFEPYVDIKKPEYLSKFPHGKIPALEQPDGFKLFEGVVVARYLASLAPDSGLLGKDAKEAALVEQWMHLTEVEVDINTNLIAQLVHGFFKPYNKSIHDVFLERQRRALKTLNEHLATCTSGFFVGECITLADIYIATQIRRAAGVNFDAAARAEFAHLTRHMEMVIYHPKLKDIYEPNKFVETAIQYTPPLEATRESKRVEDMPLKADPEPIANLSVAGHSTSTFDLDDWKTQYANNAARVPGGSIEWFYKHFDKDRFSIWRFDYKYNEKFLRMFMACNQIAEFHGCLDASRKDLFASTGVLGTEANSDFLITGVIIVRGVEVQPVVKAAHDWDSYEYRKLELENKEEKIFFEAVLAWDLEVGGKKWVNG